MHARNNGINPNTVGDKSRSILTKDGFLTQVPISIAHQKVNQFRFGFWTRDDFQKFEVARRVEKVRSCKMCLKIFRAAFRHQMHRNARGIGGDEGSWFSVFFYFFKKLLLDVQALHDHFDDPVVVLDFGKVVVKIARSDSGSEGLLVNRRWVCFERVLKCCRDNSVANGRRLFGQALLLLLLIEFKRNDIQKQHLHANVGKVTGNSGSHYP